MILQVIDASGQKKFFAGYYRDNSICWSTAEGNALDETLAELKSIASNYSLTTYTIRERIPSKPLYSTTS